MTTENSKIIILIYLPTTTIIQISTKLTLLKVIILTIVTIIMTLLGRNPNSIDIVDLQHNEQGQDRRGRMILKVLSILL